MSAIQRIENVLDGHEGMVALAGVPQGREMLDEARVEAVLVLDRETDPDRRALARKCITAVDRAFAEARR